MTATFDETVQPLARKWWLFLISGILWFLFANLIFSFDFRTVWAISLWTGFALIGSGVSDLYTWRLVESHGWVYLLLGIVSIAGGIAALVWPGATFVVLASLISWVLIFRGALLVVLSIAGRREDDLWWLTLVLGVLQIVVGFWAAQYPGRSLVLLVVWVGVAAVSKGIGDVMLAFRLRALRA